MQGLISLFKSSYILLSNTKINVVYKTQNLQLKMSGKTQVTVVERIRSYPIILSLENTTLKNIINLIFDVLAVLMLLICFANTLASINTPRTFSDSKL